MLMIRFTRSLMNGLTKEKWIEFSYNKSILELLKLLKVNKWIDFDLKLCRVSGRGKVLIKSSRIKKLSYISKPSRRVHVGYRKLLSMRSLYIVSTSAGLLTKDFAIKSKLGGVLLMKIEIE